jgi:hypothetical protein
MMLEAAGVHQDDFILAGDRDQSAIRITANRGNAVGDARTKPEQETVHMFFLESRRLLLFV